MEQISGEAQLVVRPDRDALSRYGIPVDDVMSLVANAIGGQTAGQVIHGNERYDIYVRLDRAQRSDADSIRQLLLQAPNGAWVRLGHVAQVEIESGPPQIRRDDVQRRVVIQANVVGRDMGGLVTELRQRISTEIDLPPGYSAVGAHWRHRGALLYRPISLRSRFHRIHRPAGGGGAQWRGHGQRRQSPHGQWYDYGEGGVRRGDVKAPTRPHDRQHDSARSHSAVDVQRRRRGNSTAVGDRGSRWTYFLDPSDTRHTASLVFDLLKPKMTPPSGQNPLPVQYAARHHGLTCPEAVDPPRVHRPWNSTLKVSAA